MVPNTTRRALIRGAGLAAVVAVAVAPAIATVRAPVVSTAKWDALALAFLKADAHMKALGLEHNAAYERYSLARKVLGPRPKAPDYDVYPKPIQHMTIAEIKAMPSVKSPEYAAYEVALAAWKAKDDALEAEVTGDVDARWEAAVDAQDKAADALLAEPSPTADALRFKMRLIEVSYEGSEIDTSVAKSIFADVSRFLSKEA